MPKRFITYSRTEPARTILWTVALLTIIAQALTLLPFVSGLAGLPNFALVGAVGAWGVWAATKDNIKQQSLSSFWLFVIWLWSGLVRLLVFSPDWSMLLFAPMLIVAACLSVVYLYLSHQCKVMDRNGDLD